MARGFARGGVVLRGGGGGRMGGSRRAIRSFHLRLHSSLRQQGGVFDAGSFMARRTKAKALGYEPCPFEGYAYVESWGGRALGWRGFGWDLEMGGSGRA